MIFANVRQWWTRRRAAMAAVVALFLLGAAGAIGYYRAQSAAASAQAQPTPTPTPALTGDEDPLARLESVLKEESKAAAARIDEALKIIGQARQRQAESSPAPPATSPWRDLWDEDRLAWWDDAWDPMAEMLRMRSMMDRLFSESIARLRSDALTPGAPPSWWAPRGEFEETPDAYIYRFDVPGVDKGQIRVTLRDRRLIVEGNREARVEQNDADRGLYRREVRTGRFSRVIALPADADDQGAVESKLENGVLTVKVPKKAGAPTPRVKTIEIR